jgi:adhesin/invasin
LTGTRRALFRIGALLIATLSCSSGTGPDGPSASLQLSSIAASSTSIVADGKATSQITVTLKDESGAALTKSAGVVAMTSTRGTISPVVDAGNGTYTAVLTSSTTAGAAVISATVDGSALGNTATVTFVAGPAAQISAANSSTNNQTAVVGATVANPPSVKVTDANANPVSGVTVTFAVASGGGSITGATQTTNADGIATVGSWRLGNTAGPNSLTATVSTGSSIAYAANAAADLVFTFTATATAGAPGSVAVDQGNGQTAEAGTAVAVAPSVKVVDGNGNPVNGATVNFVVASGGGSITGASTTTNASGIARVGSWTLGNTAGANSLSAAAVGVSGSVTFNATGIAGAAATLAIANASSQGQTGIAGQAVAIPPSVKVTDSHGNGVQNVSVTFAVATGGGSVTGGSATTDASGIATVGSWTLGSAAGPNTLTATSGSLSGSPITFSATGVAGVAGAITIVDGNGQSAVAGANVAVAPSVKVTDGNGNPVAGITVTFTVSGGGGSVTGATPATNALGVATVGSWKLGTAAGPNTLTAAVLGLAPATFSATGTAGAAALIASNTGNNQTANVGSAVSTAPSVKVTDTNGNAVAGAGVTFSVTTGGGSITGASQTTNSSGIATVGSWTLGASVGSNSLTATLNGVANASVVFNATGAAIPPLGVSVTGHLERGETVTILVTQNGSPVQPSGYSLTLNPVDAGTVNGDGTVKLLKTGSVVFTATVGNASGNTTVSVAQPPLIVFDMVDNFSRQIWQVAIDGGDLRQLTTTGSDNQHPSRVGKKIVYAGARNGRTFDLFSLNVTDSLNPVETQITSATAAERDPILSPNGNRITYVTNASGLDRAIYANADGTNPQFVADNTNNTGAIEISPSWSPNSDKVIFSSTAEGGSPDIWLANTLGALATKYPSPINTSQAEANPAWNSAGKIAFLTTRNGGSEIWLTDTSAQSATFLTSGASPTWLADGRIVFARYTGVQGSLFWIDPANPSVVHPIDLGGRDAQRPSAVLP